MRGLRNRYVRVVGAAMAVAAVLAGFGTAGNFLGAHFDRSQPGVVYVASDPTLPRDFALPTPLFASDSAWNQTATGTAVLPESDQQILVTYRVLRGDTTSLYPPGPPPTTWPFMLVNYDEYSIPVFRAGAGPQGVLICDYEGNRSWPHPKFPDAPQQEGGPVTVPAPAGTVRPSGPQNTDADGHLVLYHPETFMAYDYWQATTVRDGECQSRGGGLTGTTILEAGVVDFFDVRRPGANPDTYYSARAVGVPLLAGLILPEDVESGAISHALAFAIPGPRNTSTDPSQPLSSDYFYPASTTETIFYNTNPSALAAGQRIRLKQAIVDDGGNPIDENQVAPITRMFLTALRTYGAYLVDNAGGFTYSAEDIHTAVLHLTDDEVNALIGQPAGTPLPAGKTKWQIVIEKLNEELELIPIAYGPWTEGQDPATATIETSNFEVVEPATRSVTPPFTDISPEDWFYEAVMNLYNRGIIKGYPDGTFGPSNQVSRAEFCTILVRAMGWAIDISGGPHFTDVSPGDWCYDFVETAYNRGMVEGYGDGTFRPGNPISRAEIATMVVRAMGWAIDTSGPEFPDVPVTHWAYGYVKTARNHGVVGGYPDGSFKPDNPSTRAEAAAMIYRAVP